MTRQILVFAATCFAISQTLSGEKFSSRLTAEVQRLRADEPVYAWIYLTDKAGNENLALGPPTNLVSERSLQRRSKVRRPESLVDYDDIPISSTYVNQIRAVVQRVRQRSRWFNAVSVIATRQQLARVEEFKFVKALDLMARFRKNQTEEPISAISELKSESVQPTGIHTLDYGASFGQNNQINVPAVHDLGYNGTGVFVGVFDNGFRLPAHESFATMTIHATYDFVDHKVSVVPNNPSAAFGSHGVNTLSTIGGFKSGQLIGPAYGATFILARTENDSSETPIEEDNWVAAIEWADSIGVDVTSTSLGYLDYDAPYTSWTWQDMNGNTTLITRAADAAVARGILVVNSAGNNGLNLTRNTLGAPADGDSVLTIGAVDGTGLRSNFSSVGPTTSSPPRIKPDVMAQGSAVRVASATNTTGYGSSNGTSFSCPLAAGAAALLVQARPNASPIEIMNSMRNTANNSLSPNNQYGWGIINTFAAMNNIPLPIQLSYFRGRISSSCIELRWGTVSETNNYGFDLLRSQDRVIITTVPNSFVPGHGTTNEPHNYVFTDCTVPPGVWSYRLRQFDLDGTINYSEWIEVEVLTSAREEKPGEFALMQNYPNPFNPATNFGFRIASSALVTLRIFDVLGREVTTLINNEMEQGSYEITYNAKNLSGGVYFYTLKAGSFTQTRKLVLAK